MMEHTIIGKCWVGTDSLTVYQVIPEKHWTMDRMDPEKMSDWVFETVEPGAENEPGYFKRLGYTVIIAGKDFGCGSKSVEHPMAALKGAGVKLVIADSFSRYSYRNAINLGLPVITCPGIRDIVHTGDTIEADTVNGKLKNLTTGQEITMTPLSDFARAIIEAGGSVAYAKQHMGKGD